MELKLFESDNNLFILLSILILNKYSEVKTISTEKLIGCVPVQHYIAPEIGQGNIYTMI